MPATSTPVDRLFRQRCVELLPPLFLFGRFDNVPDEIFQDAADPIIHRRVDDLLAVARGTQKAACAEHPQVMTHERARNIDPGRSLANRSRLGQAGQEDAQARRFAEQAEKLREFDNLLVRQFGQRSRKGFRSNMRTHVVMISCRKTASKGRCRD